jgi:hypothetical protein
MLRSSTIVLFHVSPARNLKSLSRFGVLPAFARSSLKAAWLVTRSRLGWAIAHVRERHNVSDVVIVRVLVPRSALVRRRRGVWSSASPILPSQIIAVRPPAFAGAP